MFKLASFVLAFVAIVQAQSINPLPSVAALGTATIRIQPDQVTLNVSVVTQAGKARDAASKNAEKVGMVQDALKKVLGASDVVRTASYSVSVAGSNGYSSRATLEVKSSSPDMAGAIIDAAVGAGATSIGSVQFAVKDPDQVHRQALAAATTQAKANAEAMARAVGRNIGTILAIREQGANVTEIPFSSGYFNNTAGRSAKAYVPKVPTDVETGPIEVESTVIVEVQLN